mgnify:CR=1 FL=1
MPSSIEDSAKSIASPCIGNCCLDNDDICLGCFRHLDEIVGWRDKSNEQKEKAVALASERKLAAK